MIIFNKLLGWIKSHLILSIIFLVIIVVVGFFAKGSLAKKQPGSFQTAAVQRGTLIESVSASGQVLSGNGVEITTQASGTVKDILVKDGDSVTQGQVIAHLTLDQPSQQKLAAAYSSLLQTQSSLQSSQTDLNTLQNTEFVANQKFINDAVARGLTTDDPTFIEENASWLAAEANYKNQQNVIAQSQAAVNNASLAYAQASPVLTAATSGVINNLTITPGSAIIPTSGTSSTPQVLGLITQPGPIQAQVNLSEVDSVNVSAGQSVTMTLDALPNKTFTGKVIGINTNGAISSGVTTYPAVISFDTTPSHVYPNMTVNAQIITKVKNDVLLIPSSAVQTQGGQSFVEVINNNQPQEVAVQTGDSNDTQTEIVSGLSQGEQVVTNNFPAGQTGSGGTSVFDAAGGRGGFGGGGNFRVIRGG